MSVRLFTYPLKLHQTKIRAMFTYFREEQWVDILREIARVTKSGGYIEVQDASMIFKDFGPIGTAYAEAFGKVMVANKRNLSHATFLTNVFATTMRDTFEFVSKHDVDVPTCHDQELGRQMQEDFAYLARPLIEMLALQGSDDLTKSIDGISFDDAFGEFTTHKTTIGFFSLVAKRL
ncbi:hypothetical protein BC936DRAFT_138314 [Jimgerdemannia flammicorona]|uniref:Methyltransferase type 11 domain-containing protein n=1 Tax=Jimgerdemannia flammicorona TaxID=994334 RepID=A0A433DIE0_9FUNG|nr:hypothetical protein BC936DRAFT_138314 [Jimgerdemannia flammicorona]